MIAAIDSGRPVREVSYPVQAIRFGKDLTLLALGGEVVVDYDLRAKQEYIGEPLIVAGYSNAVMGYIPSEWVLREGGYEAVDNLMYYGQPGPFAAGVEERVFGAMHKAMKKVGDSGVTLTRWISESKEKLRWWRPRARAWDLL
jgi:hypothetical protein